MTPGGHGAPVGHGAPGGHVITPGGQSRVANRLSDESVGGHKGLQNQPGDNNCFLNSAVQVGYRVTSTKENSR